GSLSSQIKYSPGNSGRFNVINGRFLRKDIKKDKITDREMEIIRMTAQGMQPKSIARIENCSVKTVYTHRRNAEAKLYSKIYKLVQ
ncbi:helix-turn-helix transcriptional regulator, partial [Escherichia coli]|nr:helix-turn-helix transcriptional regulator [Escherichia coli]EKH9310388.1 helix-turn-helix transcriptional regulator [Escherichia coli]